MVVADKQHTFRKSNKKTERKNIYAQAICECKRINLELKTFKNLNKIKKKTEKNKNYFLIFILLCVSLICIVYANARPFLFTSSLFRLHYSLIGHSIRLKVKCLNQIIKYSGGKKNKWSYAGQERHTNNNKKNHTDPKLFDLRDTKIQQQQKKVKRKISSERREAKYN